MTYIDPEYVKKEISDLIDESETFTNFTETEIVIRPHFYEEYESWYTKAREAISTILPSRLSDFETKYHVPTSKRRNDYGGYTISDALRNIACNQLRGNSVVSVAEQATHTLIRSQRSLLKAALDSVDSSLISMRQALEYNLLRDELIAANQLASSKQLRAAGVLAGIALEKHLKSLCEIHKVVPEKKRPSLGDFNDALKSGGFYDTPTWRLVTRLADIRNYCAHPKEREPTEGEVSDLISGAEKVLAEFS